MFNLNQTYAESQWMRLLIARLACVSTDTAHIVVAASGSLHEDVRVDVPAVPSAERSATSARYMRVRTAHSRTCTYICRTAVSVRFSVRFPVLLSACLLNLCLYTVAFR